MVPPTPKDKFQEDTDEDIKYEEIDVKRWSSFDKNSVNNSNAEINEKVIKEHSRESTDSPSP